MVKISTTALSKILDISSKELFEELNKQKLIFRKDNHWHLTSKGKEFGGEIVFNKKYGEFIVWREDFDPLNLQSNKRTKLINATKIGDNLKVTSQRVNRVLAELGWIDKALKGWHVSNVGRHLGGVEFEHETGGSYVLWPDDILNNKTLNGSFNVSDEHAELSIQEVKIGDTTESKNERDKWPTPYRTKDGHRVRSRGEQMIDDYLYECGIVHAYEREVKNINEMVWSDFFIPSRNGGEQVYIEYWGRDDDKYDLRKSVKKEIYLNNNLNLIELENDHIYSLDDHLPRMLLKFKIRTD